MTSNQLDYRHDLDGLRAIAVLVVVAFHVNSELLSGGYVGVDVFFVLSGFLITRRILEDHEKHSFSLTDFYLRRIRRLVPAASFMILVTLAIGAVRLFPEDFEGLAKSALAHQAMAGNVWFWRNTGYFDGPSNLMPLLHTWSLAVEEQFYLLYPIMLKLIGVQKLKDSIVKISALLGALFVGSCYATYFHPAAAYFLLPTRAWEMLLGCCLALPACLRFGRTIRPAHAVALTACGLALIVFSSIFYTEKTRFPGIAALLPCVGGAMVILPGYTTENPIGKFLALYPLRLIGQMSYSIYLWHWPTLAIARHLTGGIVDFKAAIACLFITATISFISWRYIELPFRNPDKKRRTLKMAITLASMAAIVILSATIIRFEGFPTRIPREVIRFRNTANQRIFIHEVTLENAEAGNFPLFGDENQQSCSLAVWGDSHAMALMPAVASVSRRLGIKGMQATHSSTAPLLNFAFISRSGLNESAPDFSAAVVDQISERNISVIVLAGVWSSYSRQPEFEIQLRETIKAIHARKARAVVILDVAWQDFDAPTFLASRAFLRMPIEGFGLSNQEHLIRNSMCNDIIRQVAFAENAIVFDPAPWFVDKDGIWRTLANGDVLYRDDHHLSVAGAMRLERPLYDLLQKLLGNSEPPREIRL